MAEVQAAVKLGISPKRFAGWEPKQVTTVVEWTEEGQPRKWVTQTESEWTDDERDDIFAFLEHLADSCPRGHSLSESGHPDRDPYNPQGTHRYQASNPIVCHACEAEDAARKKWSKVGWYKDKELLFHTRLVERPNRGPVVPG
jgi:hypothetical protein